MKKSDPDPDPAATGAPTPAATNTEGSGGFTPGPWQAEDSEIYSGDTLLAETTPLAGDTDSSRPGFGATELANAHLIASAPDLYEALNELVAVIDSPEMHAIWYDMLDKLGEYRGPRFNVEKAHSALAKALGK